MEATVIMRALDPEVFDAIWTAVEPLLPPPDRSHPLGCHRPRVSDRLCLRGIVIRLVTGASWVDIEAILDFEVSDTTLPAVTNGSPPACSNSSATRPWPRSTGSSASTSTTSPSTARSTKHPTGGEGTGPNPTDRAKLGWKWSVAAEGHGLPIGWAIDGANRNDLRLLHPTLDAVEVTGLHLDIDTLHLDRGYDYPKTRRELAGRGYDELDIQRRGTKPPPGTPHRLTLGLRWVVEATNTWWSNYGQLRRSTDRRNRHRHAALCLATTILIVGRLINWRNRWSPTTA